MKICLLTQHRHVGNISVFFLESLHRSLVCLASSLLPVCELVAPFAVEQDSRAVCPEPGKHSCACSGLKEVVCRPPEDVRQVAGNCWPVAVWHTSLTSHPSVVVIPEGVLGNIITESADWSQTASRGP